MAEPGNEIVTSTCTCFQCHLLENSTYQHVPPGRLMNIFGSLFGSLHYGLVLILDKVMQRFYNHHGQPSARLDGDRSVHAPPTGIRHSLFMTLISPLLFSAPAVHLRSMHKIWVDKILRKHAYDLLVDKLNTEWQEFILFVSYIRFNT